MWEKGTHKGNGGGVLKGNGVKGAGNNRPGRWGRVGWGTKVPGGGATTTHGGRGQGGKAWEVGNVPSSRQGEKGRWGKSQHANSGGRVGVGVVRQVKGVNGNLSGESQWWGTVGKKGVKTNWGRCVWGTRGWGVWGCKVWGRYVWGWGGGGVGAEGVGARSKGEGTATQQKNQQAGPKVGELKGSKKYVQGRKIR